MVRLRPARCRLTLEATLQAARLAQANGDYPRAVELCRKILLADPGEPAALLIAGAVAQQIGDSVLALSLIDDALASRPLYALAHYNRSVVLRVLRRGDEALQAARQASTLAPELGEVWDLLAQLTCAEGRPAEAAEYHARALAIQPSNAHFYGNYGLTLQTAGMLVPAYHAGQIAERLNPAYPPLLSGNVLKALGYPAPAAACFARARPLLTASARADACASEAMALLQMGDFAAAWFLWEQRPDLSSELVRLPMWGGEKTGHLLIYEDQGLGDILQFLRYLPRLIAKQDRVTLHVPPLLRRLVKDNFPKLDILENNGQPPTVDARLRLSSLPALLDPDLRTIPVAPYLVAAHPCPPPCQQALAPPHPRIGLVWAGNGLFRDDRNRSLDLDKLAPVFDTGPAHFVFLQKGKAADHAAVQRTRVFDAAPYLDDFADTAAVMSSLDLIISVDTATAHLAGALGKPVWILLPFDSDWRWLMGREDSIWYSTARLFRQTAPGDWGPVITRLAAELRRFIQGDSGVLSPERWAGENLRQNPFAVALSA